MRINVREILTKDITSISDYWLTSDPDFLLGMGADYKKLPKAESFSAMLLNQITSPFESKKSYALIWELDGLPIGHSNVNAIEFGEQAKMHLHIWRSNIRKKGMGTELVKKSLPFFFEKLQLKKIICEPYALNPAPNKTLEKVGFKFIKKYRTIPGAINFEQEVNRWELTKKQFQNLKNK